MRLHMRAGAASLAAAILLIGLPVLTGCQPDARPEMPRVVRFQPPPAGHGAGLASALLFDHRPGPYRVSDFAYRSDWPSTEAFYSPGQVIFFAERFVDWQGSRFHDTDDFYRRFDSIRVGTGYR